MEQFNKSITPIIEANYEEMSAAEQAVAVYFLNLREEEDLAAVKVAGKVGVSEATLSRFAKRCGFSGYREFAALFKNSFVKKTNVRQEDHQLVLSSYQELLNKVYSLADEEQISRIAKRMENCRHLIFAGRGNSGLAAEELATRFKWLGIDASFIRDNENMKMQTVFLTPKDVVIGLSIRGQQPELLYLLKEARAKGGYTVIVTEKNRPVLSENVDEVVLVPSLEHLSYGNLISPQFPILVMGDLIYASYLNANKARSKANEEKIQAALSACKKE